MTQTKSTRTALIAIIVVSVVLRIQAMLKTGLTGDEGLYLIMTYTQHPPLGTGIYYVFNNIGNYLGVDPRVFVIALGIASIYLAYRIGKEIKDDKFGLILAFLLAILPVHIHLSASASLDLITYLFCLTLVYFYMKLEILARPVNRIRYIVIITTIFFIGTYLKIQAFVFMSAPLFIYGLYKHRLKIFKQELYWLLGISIIPVLISICATPEIASTLLIHFYRANKIALIERIINTFITNYAINGIIFLMFLLSFVIVMGNYKRLNPEYKQVCIFFTISTIIYLLYVIKTFDRANYIFYMSFSAAFFITALLVNLPKFKLRYKTSTTAAVIILVLFTIFSINSVFGLTGHFRSEYMNKEHVKYSTDLFYKDLDIIDDFFKGETYILAGGNVGMHTRYYIDKKLVWPSVINSPDYENIKKGIIVYPIKLNYMDYPAWDYTYIEHVLNHSTVHYRLIDATGQDVLLIEIINHTRFSDSDVKEKGIAAIGGISSVV